MKRLILLWFLYQFGCCFKHRAPVLDLQSTGGDIYHGTVKETDTVVKISPEIQILDGTGPVCSYVVETLDSGSLPNGSEKYEDNGSVPFALDVEDQTTGRAVVRLVGDAVLDCSNGVYRFKIRAKRCDDNTISDPATVEIRVEDTNNHEPTFSQQLFNVEVDEGRLYDRILQLRATDDDCGHPYGEICRYEITNNAKSFAITPAGILKNTQPLNWSVSHTHIISVVAHDCGMRRSKPVLITVKVNEECTKGLFGYSERLDYDPSTGALPLMPDVDIRFCESDSESQSNDESDCEPTSLESKIRLNVADGRPCDRENLSLRNQRKQCGADTSTVELLPNTKTVKIENSQSSSSSNEDDENDVTTPMSDEVYSFDGRNHAVIVPSTLMKPYIPEEFTLSFWMKHEKPPKSADHHNSKENILCLSDDHRMNRHHFAVYVRNCKIEVLFRHESAKDGAASPDDTFTPSEWRWRLAEACDGHWHHYSFNVKFPQIDLLVDGRVASGKGDSPEILDDWPMRNVKDIKNKLVVGACWHGGANKMAQYFKGYLSGMTLLPGKVEKPGVVQCLMQCKEQLEFFGLDKLKPGEEAVFSNDMSELTLKAKDLDDFVELLRKVSYLNSRNDPTLGERTVTVTTNVVCKGRNLPMALPSVETTISIDKRADPKITLLGSIMLRHQQSEVEQGVKIFEDLKIMIDGKAASESDQKLDFCKIKTKPALDKEREIFSSQAALIGEMNLEFSHVSGGLLLKGAESPKGYEKVLKQISYSNSLPNEFSKRIFYVECCMDNGRIHSDEFIVTLSIDPPVPMHNVVDASVVIPANQSDQAAYSALNTDAVPEVATSTVQPVAEVVAVTNPPMPVNPLAVHHEDTDNQNNRLAVNKLDSFVPEPKLGSGALPMVHQAGYDNFGTAYQTGPGGAIAIVVVVCVGFLLLLIVVGILKVRSTHRRLVKTRRPTEDGDLAWDDSGMNITVNPIEEVAPEPAKAAEDEYSEGSSDDDSYRDEDDCSDDDDEEVLPHVEAVNGRRGSTGLEWDDSTLHHPAVHNPRTHTYRV